MSSDEGLTDEVFKGLGFDTSSEPFTKHNIKVYKNYLRDGSGCYDGYLVERPITALCNTKEDFILHIISATQAGLMAKRPPSGYEIIRELRERGTVLEAEARREYREAQFKAISDWVESETKRLKGINERK
jgi:hypothetical protein